jgi:ferritin
MLAIMAMKAMITPRQREKLIEFFGEKGAQVVISHIDELDQTFGTASAVIRKIMEDNNKDDFYVS